MKDVITEAIDGLSTEELAALAALVEARVSQPTEHVQNWLNLQSPAALRLMRSAVSRVSAGLAITALVGVVACL